MVLQAAARITHQSSQESIRIIDDHETSISSCPSVRIQAHWYVASLHLYCVDFGWSTGIQLRLQWLIRLTRLLLSMNGLEVTIELVLARKPSIAILAPGYRAETFLHWVGAML